MALEPARIRRCANRCDFCFVDGLPDGLRDVLYIRDDDYRLSFRYGNFATLTNLKPHDVERIIEYRLSPLYVSVHATDPDGPPLSAAESHRARDHPSAARSSPTTGSSSTPRS